MIYVWYSSESGSALDYSGQNIPGESEDNKINIPC